MCVGVVLVTAVCSAVLLWRRVSLVQDVREHLLSRGCRVPPSSETQSHIHNFNKLVHQFLIKSRINESMSNQEVRKRIMNYMVKEKKPEQTNTSFKTIPLIFTLQNYQFLRIDQPDPQETKYLSQCVLLRMCRCFVCTAQS